MKAGTAAAIIDKSNRLLCTVLDDGNLKGELTQLGLDVETSTPQEVAARVASHQRGMEGPHAVRRHAADQLRGIFDVQSRHGRQQRHGEVKGLL